MGAFDGRGRCREAAPYYYDLRRGDAAVVPEEIRRHVAACAFCQERVRCLGETLDGIDDGPGVAAGPEDRQTIETLSRHLDLMDQQVTCAQVKPFLPHCLLPSRAPRIPTPVTVHMDRCPACAADRAALGGLHLTVEQLERLARLYSISAGRSDKSCRKSRARMAALAAPALGDVPAEVLDHVRTCISCRAEVYQRREQIRAAQGPNDAGGEAAACPGLTAAELFDVVVPYGLAPTSDVGATAAHVRTCPACRERMQALHRVLHGIAERPDSGVATVYHASDAGQDRAEEPPTRCPVQVQILYHDPALPADDGAAVGAPGSTARPARAGAGTRSLLKLACAAGVMVLMAVQFTHGPTASGLDPRDILETLEKAPSVHITSFAGGRAEPSHEVWIARRLDKLVTKAAGELVLYDLSASRARSITPDGREETARLTHEECYHLRQSMVERVRAVLVSISRDMQRKDMTAVTDSGGRPAEGFAVYELVDDRPAAHGPPVQRRWRAVVDSATGLPQRLEYFCWEPGDDRWQPADTKVFEYLSESEMAETIDAMFPPH